MHLAYMDDSGTRDKKNQFQVMSVLEFRTGAIAKSIEKLIPEEKRDQFEEFHAWELYGGYGVFDGVPQAWHLHDDMYFGSSKESVGIQTADLCGYFITKHLKGSDPAAEGFYKIIEDHIVYHRMMPNEDHRQARVSKVRRYSAKGSLRFTQGIAEKREEVSSPTGKTQKEKADRAWSLARF